MISEMVRSVTDQLVRGVPVTPDRMALAVSDATDGTASQAQLGALLMALAMRTIDLQERTR